MPMSAREVRQALHELGDLRYAAGDLDDALRRIVHATHELFAVDGAGLMLVDPDQLLRNVADSDKRVGDLEELQIEHGEGPCIDAFDDKELVHAADLADEERWPDFCPAAVERGLRAVLASPIPYNQMAIGVVTVFSSEVHPWSPEGELALVAFTDLAALTIANTMQSEQRGELATQLQRALDARVRDRAGQGRPGGPRRVSPGQAFERMRRRARAERRRVVEIAQRDHDQPPADRQPADPCAMTTDPLEALRRLCLALPETTERRSHGEPTWFVRGRRPSSPTPTTTTTTGWSSGAPPSGRAGGLVASAPERFFRPPYVGHRGWLGVYLDVPQDWEEVAELVADAYRTVAPRRLVAQLDDPGPRAAGVEGGCLAGDGRPAELLDGAAAAGLAHALGQGGVGEDAVEALGDVGGEAGRGRGRRRRRRSRTGPAGRSRR